MTSTTSRLYTRTAGFRALGVSLAALEGVLAISGGVALAVQNYRGARETSLVATVGPILVVMFGALLLRVSGAVMRRAGERHSIDHLAIAAGTVGQLSLSLPLLWLTITDPVDARTNVLLTIVALTMTVGGIGVACTWFEAD